MARKMAIKSLLLIFHLLFLQFLISESDQSPPLVSRIAFGSCANQSAPQIFVLLVAHMGRDFIWLRDNIYGDNRRLFAIFGKERTIGPLKNTERFYPSSEQEMSTRYHQSKTKPGTRPFFSKHGCMSFVEVICSWDDHDYGLNNEGKELSEKDTNQKLMVDFLDEPHDNQRWASVLFHLKVQYHLENCKNMNFATVLASLTKAAP